MKLDLKKQKTFTKIKVYLKTSLLIKNISNHCNQKNWIEKRDENNKKKLLANPGAT